LISRASRGLDVEKFERLWSANKSELDSLKQLDPETAETDRREVLERFRKMVQECSNARLKKITTPEVIAQQQALVTPEQRQILNTLKMSLGTKLEPKSLDRGISHAIEHCFQKESVVKDYELYETVLQYMQGSGVNLEEMRAKIVKDPRLVIAARNEVAAADHYRKEFEVKAMIERGRGRGNKVDMINLKNDLSDQQRAAVKRTLESVDQFTALSGSAGVGKTEYFIAPVVEANLAAGHRVRLVAPSDAARDVLIATGNKNASCGLADVFKSATSLQLFQADPRLHDSLGKDDLLVVDEASMISLSQGHALLQWAEQRGVRVLLVGDLDQGQSIEAGDFFRLAIDSGIHTAQLHDIKRQRPDSLDGHYLKAVRLFKKGRTTEAFRELHQAGCIRESRGPERIKAIADSIAESDDVLAVNVSHAENDAIASAVRDRLKEQGKLTDERTLSAYRTLGWTDAQKKDVSKIRPGMILEIVKGPDKGRAWKVIASDGTIIGRSSSGELRAFGAVHHKLFDVCEQRDLQVAIGDKLLVRSKRGKVINGEVLTITGWDDRGDPIDSRGRSITHRNLTHAYASTICRSQGSSSRKVVIGFDRSSIRTATQSAAYVACSRGRELCEIHVESISDLSAIQNRSGIRKFASAIMARELPAQLQRIVDQIGGTKKELPKTVDLQAARSAWMHERECEKEAMTRER
jgi:DNA replication protein DnaC